MKSEILTKLKELEELIIKSDSDIDKTMVDFFKPSARNMVRSVGDRIKRAIESLKIADKGYSYIDFSPIYSIIDEAISRIDAETLLEISTGISENELAFMIEVREYIKSGSKLQAVKLYKDKTGLGLKECKEKIDQLSDEIFGYRVSLK